uniref:Transferrin-like domain-containing protein n=1 Tax=Plectus sambesii TaxID=2011161 RepID=A0A914W995_9BILA
MRSAAFALLHGILFVIVRLISSQPMTGPLQIEVRLCVPQSELMKCKQLQFEMRQDATLVENRGNLKFFVAGQQQSGFLGRLTCVPTHHIYECADLIRDGAADVARFSAEDLFGLHQTNYSNNALVPIVASETSSPCSETNADCHEFVREYSVALTRRGGSVKNWANLRDSDVCFEKVGSTAGWVLPVSRLKVNFTATETRIDPKIAGSLFRILLDDNRQKRQLDEGARAVYNRCPLDLSVPNSLFAKSCAPGQWALDPNFVASYGKLCKLCSGVNQQCQADVEQNGALNCLQSKKGEVAFVSSLSITKFFHEKELLLDEYKLLCPEGLSSAKDFQGCHWAHIPEDAFLVHTPSNNNQRIAPAIIGEFLRSLYFTAKAQYYTAIDLLGRSEPKRLDRLSRPVGDIETYLRRFGGHQFYDAMEQSSPTCPQKISARLCVVSSEEEEKCNHIKVSFRAAALTMPLECVIGVSDADCVEKLNNNEVDLAVMGSHKADEFMHQGKVRPILAEINDHTDYAIALALLVGRVRNLHDFANNPGQLNVCSAGTDSFAGWEAPNRIFKDIGLIDAGECDKLTERWATMFRASCVPGATNATVTEGRRSPIDAHEVSGLCASCMGGAGSCLTPQQVTAEHSSFDSYYGDIGALRCLMRRKGDVAFLRSNAVKTMQLLRQYNLDPDFRQIGENQLTLLCGDGIGPMPYSEANVAKCNLGRTPRRWMVTKPGATDLEVLYWQDQWEMGLDRARNNYDWLKTYVHVTPGKTD